MMVFNWQKYISSCFFKIYMFSFPFYYFLPWAFAMFFELMNLSLWEKVICTWPEINKGECSHLNKKNTKPAFYLHVEKSRSRELFGSCYLGLTLSCCFTGLWASGCFLQFWIRNVAQHTYQEVCGSVSSSADSARGIFLSSLISLLNTFIHLREPLWVISNYIIISTAIGSVY